MAQLAVFAKGDVGLQGLHGIGSRGLCGHLQVVEGLLVAVAAVDRHEDFWVGQETERREGLMVVCREGARDRLPWKRGASGLLRASEKRNVARRVAGLKAGYNRPLSVKDEGRAVCVVEGGTPTAHGEARHVEVLIHVIVADR